MKRLTVLLTASLTLISLFAFSAPAEANGRFRGGVFLNFGVPWPGYWGPRYYYPGPGYYYDDYYYAPPPAVIVQRPSPPTYIERSDVESAPPAAAAQSAPPASQVQPQQWWYWCQASEKYFPYVKECAGGFQRVPAQPVPPANR